MLARVLKSNNVPFQHCWCWPKIKLRALIVISAHTECIIDCLECYVSVMVVTPTELSSCESTLIEKSTSTPKSSKGRNII